MARKPRIQFSGALYHVINRGNFRRDLFDEPGSAEAFEKALSEACEKCGWQLGAYCIMSNHFHLALATPKGNLVEGMHWLQSTFGNRFNRFHGETGHVFQGRYRAILVEPGPNWSRVVDYIHLNPVRAGLVIAPSLHDYRWSSYPKFAKKRTRPPFLHCDDWLDQLNCVTDTPAGWRAYQKHLEAIVGGIRKEESEEAGELGKGWILGSRDFRRAVLKEYEQMNLARDWGGPELRELNEMQWEETLKHCLEKMQKATKDIDQDLKSAEWKAAIAWWLKGRTSANNRWLGEHLNMGPPAMVSRLTGEFPKKNSPHVIKTYQRLLRQ